MASLLTRRRIFDQTLFDPHFASVSLLLGMDGPNNGTSLLDSSRIRHVVTANTPVTLQNYTLRVATDNN